MVLKIPTLADGSVMLLERQITEIPYAAQTIQRVTIRLRPNMIKHLLLHFTFSAEGEVIALAQDYPWQIIDNITITTPRGEILKNVSGRQLHLLNMMERNTDEYSTFPANSTVAPFAGQADLVIPFENWPAAPDEFTPRCTELNTNEFTELYLTINWNSAAFIYPGASITNIVFNCYLYALEREPVNLSDQMEPRKKLVDYDTLIRQAPDDHLEYLLPENTLIKTIMITCYEEDGGRSPEIYYPVAKVSIEDDDLAHSLREWSGQEIKSQNQYYYHLQPGQAEGIFVIEFDQLRDLTSCYKTFGINYPKLVIDFNLDPVTELYPYHVGIFIRQVTTPPALTIL